MHDVVRALHAHFVGGRHGPKESEFSGACTGCGETPYLKLMTQLFGDRVVVANATGCSSIYGGNLPTTPWTTNDDGRGPAWCNSLFEDNAEFGLGFRLSLDKQAEFARELVKRLESQLGSDFADSLLTAVVGDLPIGAPVHQEVRDLRLSSGQSELLYSLRGQPRHRSS